MPVNRVDPSGAGPETGPDPRRDHAEDDASRGGPEAVQRLHRQLEELAEYVRLYFAARGDALRASLRMLAVWLVVGVAGLVVLVAMLATAAVIAIVGIADVAALALGGPPWAGYLVTGLGLLAIAALALTAALGILRRRFRKRTVEKYARRHRAQRARFGHDVSEQAASGQPERS